MQNKIYSTYGKATSKDGKTHYVTVVGKYNQINVDTMLSSNVRVKNNRNKNVIGTLMTPSKEKERILKMAYSICNPVDEFNVEVGIAVAKSRLHRDPIGELRTRNATMLNDDQCLAAISCELDYITKNIDKFIKKYKE